VNFVLHRGEELPFSDDSFDLIVNRNVTWNLEFPLEALREWKRVLRPGGRMVYFDANWYLYLFDEELRARREALRREYRAAHPEFTSSGDLGEKRARDLERIAFDLPLSREIRPQWDREILTGLGLRLVRVIEDIGPLVQTEDDRARELLTAMFMICAEKEVD
jgi:SAM-dependent methyltransferase